MTANSSIEKVNARVGLDGQISYKVTASCHRCSFLNTVTLQVTIVVEEDLICENCQSPMTVNYEQIKSLLLATGQETGTVDDSVFNYDKCYVHYLAQCQNLNSSAPEAIKVLSELWLNQLTQQYIQESDD